MSLYEDLASTYDSLFPPNPAATAFILGLAGHGHSRHGEVRRVLDLGCATGSQLLDLAASGWEAHGLEPSLPMLEKARAKAELADLDVDFREGGMLDAATIFPAGHFDLALCLGNTLPHLGSREELGAFAASLADLLGPGGFIVLQLLNYDLVLDTLAREDYAFPPLEAAGVTFLRRYESAGGKKEEKDGALGRISFRTGIRRDGGQAIEDLTMLTPFSPGEVAAALEARGFSGLSMTAGWQAEPGAFDAKRDPYLILCAARPPRD
jgi:SAM-dependent methyltransferase